MKHQILKQHSVICPLCHGTQCTICETIKATDLISAYKRVFQVKIIINIDIINYSKCSTCGLCFFTPATPGDESLYSQLQRFPWYYQENKSEYEFATKFIPPDSKVLEVGAGKAAFQKLIPNSYYTGLEFSSTAIQEAKGRGVTLLNETIEKHAENKFEHYDAVISFQVLEHVQDPRGFLSSCIATIKNGGLLIIAVPNRDGICGIAHNSILDMPPHHLTHWNKRCLNSVAHEFRLSVVEIKEERIDPIHLDWAKFSTRERIIRNLLFCHSQLIDFSLRARIARITASASRRICDSAVPNIPGHTISACFRKP